MMQRGFTLIELMIVVSILAIMATFALPSYQDHIIQTQVKEGFELAGFIRKAIAEYYSQYHTMPDDNQSVGLPVSRLIVGNYVSSIKVINGAIIITYGNRANKNLHGKILTLRPAIVKEAPIVPIAWVCGTASTPEGMEASGQNQTNIPNYQLPLDCR